MRLLLSGLFALCLFQCAVASMEELTGFTAPKYMGAEYGEAPNPMAIFSLRKSPYDEGTQTRGMKEAQETLNSNVNSVLSILMGSQQSSERKSIHNAIDQQHAHIQGLTTVGDVSTHQALLEEPDVPSHHSGGHHRHEEPHHHHAHHSHHQSAHHSAHHSEDEEESLEGQALIEEDTSAHHESHHSSHHHHQPHHTQHSSQTHNNSHRRTAAKTRQPAAKSSKGPTQIADVIEQLEVEGDGTKAFPDPHLRDKLKRKAQTTMHRGDSARPVTKRAPPTAATKEDDDVPLDEFGLKKDCHWIQMDFTQNSDNCNQCMTVADAFFRGDDVCVCYKDKGGSPMRTKCNELAQKMKESEDHIRELAVENQWNEYFKSYGLCENFGHCGA